VVNGFPSPIAHGTDRFIKTVKPALVNWNHYALLVNGGRPNYFENLEIVRKQTAKADLLLVQIILFGALTGV